MDKDQHVKKVCEAAKRLLDSGWSVFPISIDKRLPLDEWKKYQTEHVTEDEIDQWQDIGAPCKGHNGPERTKPFNLALVTGIISGIVVVDCDNQEAIDYATKHGLTSPFKVKTTRGYHYYFRHPGAGIELRNKVGSNPGAGWYAIPGLDFRGDGGYVVSPPSIKTGPDGEQIHQYDYEWPEGLDSEDMPVWSGQVDTVDSTQEFSFASLNLSSTRVIDRNSLDIEEQVKTKVAYLGRKLQGPDKGDGTDNWMIKFCGQKVREGLQGKDLITAVENFFNTYFDYDATPQETERWLSTKLRSAIEMDKRNHKNDYIDGSRKGTEEAPPQLPVTQKVYRGIYLDDIPRILASLGETEYHADPLLPAQSIVQVVGYNGHGKSFFLMSLLMSAAAGQTRFGPYELSKKTPKILYMDFDNPGRTVAKRMQGFADQFGHPHHNFALWSAGLIPAEDGGDINMNTDVGLEMLRQFVHHEQPDIIVIDTIRNAFGGFDENSAQDWFKVGHVAKLLRDCKFKCTVVLVHHRNKPGDNGLGREAGSTAQMTNVDTQIMVTQVYDNEAVAKKKAGLYTGNCTVTMPNILGGGSETADKYLLARAKMHTTLDLRLRMISEISFGKVRQTTELHDTHYIGYAEELETGRNLLVSTHSKKQMAIHLYKNGEPGGSTLREISQGLMVPKHEIERWIKSSDPVYRSS